MDKWFKNMLTRQFKDDLINKNQPKNVVKQVIDNPSDYSTRTRKLANKAYNRGANDANNR